MSESSNAKLVTILKQILEGYTLNGTYPEKLEYSADSLARKADVHITMIPMILEHLETKQIIKSYGESGEDFVIPELTYTVVFANDFKKKAETFLEENDVSDNNKSPQGKIMYLEKDGVLHHGEKFRYEMDIDGKRFKILNYLAENDGYQTTDRIAHEVDSNKQNVRTEITKIRNNITHFLKIDGKELIEAKSGSGYRINPKYNVIVSK